MNKPRIPNTAGAHFGYLGHFRQEKFLRAGHNTGPDDPRKHTVDDPRLIKGESQLTGDLRGPTGKDFRAKGGYTATEVVATVDLPKKKGVMNVPLLVPGQTDVKRILRGNKEGRARQNQPTPTQIARSIKYAKAHGAPRYKDIPSALEAEYARHKRLEEEYD